MKAWALFERIGTIFLLVGIIGYLIWLSLRKADDPGKMVFRWVLTLATIVFIYFVAIPPLRKDGMEAMYGLALLLFCAIGMIIVWRQSIGSLIAAPFAALYDGGDVPPEPKPQYSVALARRKQGLPREAIEIIQHQLELFPTDLEGQMLLADIQANDLKDLPAAEEAIQHFVAQPGHAPANTAYALYSLADWYLAVTKDRDSARRCLEQIVQALPETEFALGASNRIAHLGTEDAILAGRQNKEFVVKQGVRNLGLVDNHEEFVPQSANPGELAGKYVKHLEEHPLDTEVREKLAIIYCDHFNRLDLAEGELERMITEPQQPARMVVHWLNLMADLQVRSGASYETVRQTLERIIERGPNLAPAQVARNRIDRLKLELKSQQKNQAVKLGSYEQNIGLKEGSAGD